MKILKTLGIVAAFHAAAYFLFFVAPGCRSTPSRPAPADTDASPAAPPVAAYPADAGDMNASGSMFNPAPEAVVRTPSSTTIRYSPTRPGSLAASALQSTPPPEVVPTTTYTVVSGDNLTKIAKRHGLTVAELAKANRLSDRSMLQIGQKLVIPAKSQSDASAVDSAGGGGGMEEAIYVVKSGDTLGGIARRTGATVAELKRINNLKSDTVRIGQELKLPAGDVAVPPDGGTEPEPPRKADGALVHVIKYGETLSDIAKKYHVKVSEIALVNNIGDPNMIRQGQELVIPGFTATDAPMLEAPGAAPAFSPAPPAPPSAGQDLDTGLRDQEVPIIKVEEPGAPGAP